MKIDSGTPLDCKTVSNIMDVVAASRNLNHALDTFGGNPKGVFAAYLEAGLYRDQQAPMGLKSIHRMSADLGNVVARTTIGRWLHELEPELARRIVLAHPRVGTHD